MLNKISVKEAGKPYKISVTARKYTEWKGHPWFTTMGGLLGFGAEYKRNITAKISLNIYLNYGITEHLKKVLTEEGFEEACSGRVTGYRDYILVEVKEFSRDDIEQEAKKYCEELKHSLLTMLKNEIETFFQDEWHKECYKNSIWNDLDVEIKGGER